MILASRSAGVSMPCTSSGSANDLRDGTARAQRRERILENDLHPAPIVLELVSRQRQDVAPVDTHLAGRRFVQAQDRAAECRFAATRLADETIRLTAFERQADVVDGTHVRDDTLEQPAAHREIFSQSANVEQWPDAAGHAAASGLNGW